MKRISITLSNDLVAHLDALKSYYGYERRSEVVEKALDELINQCSSDEAFHYYLAEAREILNERETKE